MTVRPAKTQINLGIRPVWPESSLSAWRKLGSLAIHWAHSEDSDQTRRMPRLIWIVPGRIVILLDFVMRLFILRFIPQVIESKAKTYEKQFTLKVRQSKNI